MLLFLFLNTVVLEDTGRTGTRVLSSHVKTTWLMARPCNASVNQMEAPCETLQLRNTFAAFWCKLEVRMHFFFF